MYSHKVLVAALGAWACAGGVGAARQAVDRCSAGGMGAPSDVGEEADCLSAMQQMVRWTSLLTPAEPTLNVTTAGSAVCRLEPDRILIMGNRCRGQFAPECREQVPRCLDYDPSVSKVQLHRCGVGVSASRNQQWLFSRTSSQIRWNHDPTKCLSLCVSGQGGAALVVADCQDACAVASAPAEQGFCIDAKAKGGRGLQVKSSCLSIPSTKPGEPAASKETSSTMCLAADDPDTDGSRVAVRACKPTARQTWRSFGPEKTCRDRGGCQCDCMWTLYTGKDGRNACEGTDDHSCCYACCCYAPHAPSRNASRCTWPRVNCTTAPTPALPPAPTPAPTPAAAPAPTSSSDTYLEVYDGADDCSGNPTSVINLNANSDSYCTSCWDRCADGVRYASYLIRGPGAVAIAWNCIGRFDGYEDAEFERGGRRTAAMGCLESQGGGTFVLCNSTAKVDSRYQDSFTETCYPA
mmetsp:Transcript_97626/g.309598  ORF Transcript_97626/g.309598 Transcript_97626/m.309598 type:complete len:465 (-) Transcript_97626:44-1438(-)